MAGQFANLENVMERAFMDHGGSRLEAWHLREALGLGGPKCSV